ncbi:hypothetical protein [Clostridium culturomicium]|uniref:hypothetical protein n=1 Tax=Clostridium culturomicium TaxID=1499683 RepID=UPI0011DD9DBA|nr:hypothetical protein [Clostridium culturomicium]
MNEVTANQVTENLLSNSDWHVLAEYMEDAIEQSNFDTVLVKEQLVYFLKTDNYWITWTKKCAQLF